LSIGVGCPQIGTLGVRQNEVSVVLGHKTEWSSSLVGGVGGPVHFSAANISQNNVTVGLDGQLCLARWADQGVGGGADGAWLGHVGLGDEGIAQVGNAREVISEDSVLGTISETVLSGVDGSTLRVGWVGHIVALVVSPVHGLLGLVAHNGLVAPVGVQVAWGLSITSDRGLRRANNTLGWVGDVALEGGHVHLVSSSDRIVDPEPCANALAVGAGREVGNVEGLKCASNAVAGSGHDDEILGLDGVHVGFVGNAQGTSCNVSALRGVEV